MVRAVHRQLPRWMPRIGRIRQRGGADRIPYRHHRIGARHWPRAAPARAIPPFELDTRGLGAVFRAAADLGARRCIVGIGGSATNDAGFGVARSLAGDSSTPGEATSNDGPSCIDWRSFAAGATAPVRRPRRGGGRADPLLGPQDARGCTGLRKDCARGFRSRESCLRQLAKCWSKSCTSTSPKLPERCGRRLGFGLSSFLGARIEPGFGLFAEQAHLDDRLAAADLVITGEGAMDEQTLMGKGVGELALHCQRAGCRASPSPGWCSRASTRSASSPLPAR